MCLSEEKPVSQKCHRQAGLKSGVSANSLTGRLLLVSLNTPEPIMFTSLTVLELAQMYHQNSVHENVARIIGSMK